MLKSKAIRLEIGTIVIFQAPGRRHLSFGELLARVERVTPRGGILAQPVREIFGGRSITYRPFGPAEWVPYSAVQLAYPTHRRSRRNES